MAKKSKDAEGEADDAPADGHIPVRLADHPRASRSIPRIRAWGAVIGFGVAAYFGDKAGLPFVDLVLRSILIGFATGLAVWAGAQAVWKQIVFAEIAVARKEAAEKQKELIEAIEQGREQPPGQG
ncbi:MAG: hypothetical protein JHD16_14035 [Solirubrobacteraceae bacterium]|nr:hypothetical protein [Solirubrobacteraceae bacterium]